MEHTTEDILSFSNMVSYGLSCPFGKAWTTREIDGLYYNQFLNPKFHDALRNIRQRYKGQAEPDCLPPQRPRGPEGEAGTWSACGTHPMRQDNMSN